MYGIDHGGWMFGGGGFMMLLWWLVPIALVVALAVYFAKPSGGQSTTEKNALDILKERYARGEIGKDEFEQKKHDLGS
jgi:putative membrane protein